MRTDPTFWLLARAAGLAAYVLLTSAVLAGLVLAGRPPRRLSPPSVLELHRTLTWLALGAVGLHGAALALDPTVHLSLVQLLVPGAAPYRPLATAAGVLAAELALLVAVSFRLRRRIGVRAWRRLHYATFAVFAAATLHGLLAGSDSARPWALPLYGVATGAVSAALAARIVRRRPIRPGPHPAPAARPAHPTRRPEGALR